MAAEEREKMVNPICFHSFVLGKIMKLSGTSYMSSLLILLSNPFIVGYQKMSKLQTCPNNDFMNHLQSRPMAVRAPIRKPLDGFLNDFNVM